MAKLICARKCEMRKREEEEEKRKRGDVNTMRRYCDVTIN
jgi:hypothetical protein